MIPDSEQRRPIGGSDYKCYGRTVGRFSHYYVDPTQGLYVVGAGLLANVRLDGLPCAVVIKQEISRNLKFNKILNSQSVLQRAHVSNDARMDWSLLVLVGKLFFQFSFNTKLTTSHSTAKRILDKIRAQKLFDSQRQWSPSWRLFLESEGPRGGSGQDCAINVELKFWPCERNKMWVPWGCSGCLPATVAIRLYLGRCSV